MYLLFFGIFLIKTNMNQINLKFDFDNKLKLNLLL